jgi:hypothetical protein
VVVVVFGFALASHCDAARAASLNERKICSVHKCTTLVASLQVRVFQATARRPGRESYMSTFAQWRPTGRVTALGDDFAPFEGSILRDRPTLAGPFVGYALEVMVDRYTGGFGEDVGRLDARTGRLELKPADGKGGGGFEPGSPGVTDVAVSPAGSVAWMIEGSFGNPNGQPLAPGEAAPASKAIYLLVTGATTPLAVAYSPTIDPGSLAAIPGHIFWLEAGAARTYAAA